MFKNHDVIVGELKSMEQGIAVVSTDYSDTDFKISWKEVRQFRSTTAFFITTSDELRYFGTLHSPVDGRVHIRMAGGEIVDCAIDDVVYLRPVEATFLGRLSATIEAGVGLAQANSLRQFSTRSSLGYRTEEWLGKVSLSSLNSTQDNAEPIHRTEGTLSYTRILPGRYYAIATISALTNTEQKLDLRQNVQLALGMYIFRTIDGHLGAEIGVNSNVERYSSETGDRSSWEGLLGTAFDVYGAGDLRLLATVFCYPSITEKGRWRVDANADLKYDLPLDFYIKLGGSLNYDNRPASGASETDYVADITFGWEW